MSKRGEINGWRCELCERHTYCVHVDDGVTPMFLKCRATAECLGTGVSLMYPKPPIPEHVREAVAWEWFKPSPVEMEALPGALRYHIVHGGLHLRPLTDAGRNALAAALSEGSNEC
jgi:hypothetical protein